MSQDWIVTFNALKAVYSEQAFSNIAINEAVEQRPGCSVGFVRTFTKGVIRDSIKLDYYIDRLAEKGIRGIKTRTLIILRMGIFAIESLASVPDYAAVNEAVALARKLSKGSEKFVNALLRSFIRRREELAINDSELGLKYSFPNEIVSLIKEQYGDETEAILKGLSQPAPMVIRCNLNRISREELCNRLSEEGIETEILSESNSAILCHNGAIISSDTYSAGLFSVQSLSSILAIERFAPSAGARVLDMCAAPGGKTCAMSELMRGQGEITACDIYPHRLELINASCKRLGITNVECRIMNGSEHDEELDSQFDYVLADVPCSGLGVIAGKPEIKLRTKTDEYSELTQIQAAILENAYKYLKPGGLLEYSTCTINKNENENVINSFAEGCESAQILEFNTFLPYNNKIGFFYALIRKSLV